VNDGRLMLAAGLSFAAIVAANELRIFQRILHTESLSLRQWLLCIGLGLTVVVASELYKLWLRRGARADAPRATATTASVGTPA
jgi:Ca2+-transporting ATPase